MADTAAFFAKKKKAGTKKKFKAFNANKIDVSSVTTITHVDAPEITAGGNVGEITTGLGLSSLGGEPTIKVSGAIDNDQWADDVERLAPQANPGVGGGSGSGAAGWGNSGTGSAGGSGESKVTELLDMAALQAQRSEQDDVAERLRIEATKAQLARAKEGMAKEAERIAAEKEKKEAAKVATSATGGDTTGKWVPSHKRAGTGISRLGSGSSFRGQASMDGGGRGVGIGKTVDMADEELFPDLASADKILAAKEQEKQKKPVGGSIGGLRGGSGWGPAAAKPPQRQSLNLMPPSSSRDDHKPEDSPATFNRKPLNLAPPSERKADNTSALIPPVAQTKISTKKVESVSAKSTESQSIKVPSAAPSAAPPVASTSEKKTLKKKKKKDLSTFKLSSS